MPKVAVYDVELKERANGETVNRGVAIRHLDTSQWSAGHAAFIALGRADFGLRSLDFPNHRVSKSLWARPGPGRVRFGPGWFSWPALISL